MSLDEYKANIDRLMHLAALDLTDEEFDALIAWAAKEYGWSFLGKKGLYEKDVPKWISYSERLPDKGGTYLIACGNGLVTTDEFMVWPDRVKTYYNWDDFCGGIQYWMEIPKPPNEFFESLKTGLEQAINGDVRETIIEAEEAGE